MRQCPGGQRGRPSGVAAVWTGTGGAGPSLSPTRGARLRCGLVPDTEVKSQRTGFAGHDRRPRASRRGRLGDARHVERGAFVARRRRARDARRARLARSPASSPRSNTAIPPAGVGHIDGRSPAAAQHSGRPMRGGPRGGEVRRPGEGARPSGAPVLPDRAPSGGQVRRTAGRCTGVRQTCARGRTLPPLRLGG